MSSVVSETNAAMLPARTRRRRISRPLVAAGLVLLGWWMITALIIGTDPYDLYPWGISPTLRDADYGPNAPPFLVDVVAKDSSIDTVLIGSSTTRAITHRMMENILPGTHRAFNLSYFAARGADRQLVTHEIAAYSHAKRVLLALDWFYVTGADVEARPFPNHLYDTNPSNDLRTVSLDGLRLTAETLVGAPLWLKDWDYAAYRREIDGLYRGFQQRQRMNLLAAKIAAYKNGVDVSSKRTCSDFSQIRDRLVPFAKALSSKNTALDFILPSLSLALYYDWMNKPSNAEWGNIAAFPSDYLVFQRCLVNAVAGIEGVRVFSFDNEDWLTGDLKNYWDTAHIFGEQNYEFLLRSIAEGSHQLTPQNVDEHLAILRQRILSYRLRNTNFRDLYASDK